MNHIFTCKQHESEPIRMESAILTVRFPLGFTVVRGFRCPSCSEEHIPADEVEATQATAESLGFFDNEG